MSLTLAAALKAYLESQGLGIAVYRDFEPTTAALPFVVIHEGISRVPALSGDHATLALSETLQIDLFMKYENVGGDGRLAESATLPDDLQRVLQVATFPATGNANAPPKRVLGLTNVYAAPREADRDSNLVRIPFTATVKRDI